VLKDCAQSAGKEALLQIFNVRVVKWWIPDDVVFLPEIPKTSVGKFLKRSLREQFQLQYLDKGEVG
jgi:fatty-acyl-CoA synthase